MDVTIEVSNLTKKINNNIILDNIDFKVKKGTIHGLIGLNGSGKSTTIKIICGLIQPTFGTIKINGLNIRKFYDEIKKNLGYVPESPYFYPSLTVKETLDFIGRLYSIPKNDYKYKMQKYMDFFEANHLLNKYIGNLSRGELQKVLISSVFMREPLIMIFDEPFYALDPKSVRTFIKIIEKKSQKGTTFLISTHLFNLVENLCEYYTIIDNGVTLISGDSKKIINYNNHESLVDAFLKYTNR